MYQDNERLVVSATDVVGYLSCPHYTTLSLTGLGATSGRSASADASDPDGETDLDVVQRRGDEHEKAYLATLRAEGLKVVEIPDAGDLAERERLTVEAMRDGADIVFQGTFLDTTGTGPEWRGHADFLRRVDTIDGDHSDSFTYEPEDTKLARHVKPSALVQLCLYAEQLERIQGHAPEQIHVILGGQVPVSFTTRELSAYYRHAKSRFVTAVESPTGATYPTPVEHCAVCRYAPECDARRTADDHLSLVANMTGPQTRKLVAAGVPTVAALAALAADEHVTGIGVATLERLRRQARLQVQHRDDPEGPLPVELLAPLGPGLGLEAMPLPNEGDLFFDMEGDPFVEGGREYLFGVGWIVDSAFEFRAFWGHTLDEEKAAFEAFIDFVSDRRRLDPKLHIYHYAPYEHTALGKLAGRHGTREVEVDGLFRDDVLVDLYQVVRQSIAVGSPSYSIKKLEPLYMAPRDGAITDAGSSIVQYERWLQGNDQQILDDIEAYNRDDCESTWRLRDWLEARRPLAEQQFGATLSRPLVIDDTAAMAGIDSAADSELDELDLVAELEDQLDAAIDALPVDALDERHALRMLSHLLNWHRREAKPEWWMYFTRLSMTSEELFDDTEAITGLVYEGVAGQEKRSLIHRYRFDPDQESKLHVGVQVVDPDTERAAAQIGDSAPDPGSIVAVDMTAGTIDLKRGATSMVAHPTSLIPAGPIKTTVLQASIRRVAADVIARGIDAAGPGQASRDLLLGRPPRIVGVAEGDALFDRDTETDMVEVASRLALGLDRSTLAVQGPPGCGKTYTAARVVLRLVAAGHRVGITANSHAVITNLIGAILDATDKDPTLGAPRIVQKGDDEQGHVDARVEVIGKASDVDAMVAMGGVDIVAGTPWQFARAGMAGTVDYLIVDEAGQLSLANIVAVSPAAANLILVGDPQQLAQPSKGSHPGGAEVSGLDYVLDDRETIPDDEGLFLDSTYRMHPDICAFISELAYEQRLHSVDGCEQQTVAPGALVAGSGVRWVAVEHEGNRTSSDEEVDALADLYAALLGRKWTNEKGTSAPMTAADILVVAPYNAQVNRLSDRLGSAARVGTVDKFQGREAAVVIVSMTASSADDVPRGMEFLYSRNRLNVAVSRAKAMSIVVGSPTLLAARCRTLDQMRLVNGLCRYVEFAEQQTARS